MNIKKKMFFMGSGSGGGVLQRSLAISAVDQAPYSQTNPSLLNYYNGVIDIPFTVSCDVKWTNNGALQAITEQSKADRSIINFQLRLNADGSFLVIKLDSAGAYILQATDATIGAGWKRVVVTHAAGIFAIFVDATAPAQTPNSSGVFTHMATMDSNYRQWVAGLPGGLFPATSLKIDNLTFYNRVLTGLEIIELQAIVGGDPTGSSFASSILSCFKFNNNLNDSGPNGYTLTSVATPNYSTDVP